VHILRKLSSEKCPVDFKHYQNLIVACGGASKVLNDMMVAVDSHFRDLQNKMVTLEV